MIRKNHAFKTVWCMVNFCPIHGEMRIWSNTDLGVNRSNFQNFFLIKICFNTYFFLPLFFWRGRGGGRWVRWCFFINSHSCKPKWIGQLKIYSLNNQNAHLFMCCFAYPWIRTNELYHFKEFWLSHCQRNNIIGIIKWSHIDLR